LSFTGTPPPRPLGAAEVFPFAAYFFLSSIDPNLDPSTDENPEPLLPLDVIDALDDCEGDIVLFHGVKWFLSVLGEKVLVPWFTLPMGECSRANLSCLSFSTCFFSSFCICFSVTLRALAPLDAMIAV
jgi:hypothetical protein